MKSFTKIVNKILDYNNNQQENLTGSGKNKWFDELIMEDGKTLAELIKESKDDIFTKFDDARDCGTKSAAKEMIDFLSQVKRAKEIRDKKRADFFCGGAIRIEGIKFYLERKKEDLSDLLK